MAEQLGLPEPQAGWQLIADITTRRGGRRPSACSPGTLIIERVWWTVNRTGPRDWLSLTPAQINVAVEWTTAPAWRQSKSLSRRMKGNCWRTGSERGTGRNPRARRGGVVAERQRVTAEIAELISRAPEHARRLVTLPEILRWPTPT